MSLTRANIRGKVYSGGKVAGMGFSATADSIAADGIIHAAAFQDAMGGEGDYSSMWQYRPGLADPNRIKSGSIIDGSKWTQEQSNYNDALTDAAYEAVGLLHPDIFNRCIALAQRRCYATYYWPLGWQTDNDFASSLTTSPHDWTSGAVNMTTIAKSSTGNVYTQAGQTGRYNLTLTGSGAGNGYVKSSSLYVEPGDQLFHGGIGRANGAYTASYVLYDATNSVALETVTFASRAFQRIALQTTIPSGCREVQVRIGNVTASGVTEWDCLFGHLLGREYSDLGLPSWLNKRFQFLGFGPANYQGRSTATHLWNATSRQIEAWFAGTHYEPLPLEADATISRLQVNHDIGLTDTDYWLEAKRPYSDFGDLDDEDDTTDCSEDLLMPAVYAELAEALLAEYDEPRFARLLSWAQHEVALQRAVRTPPQPTRVRQLVRIGLRR